MVSRAREVRGIPKKAKGAPAGIHNPLFLGEQPLGFDNVSSEELVELSPTLAADRFLSMWMKLFDPYVTFSRALTKSDKSDSQILREIKNFHVKLVSSDEWGERKYVEVLNAIMEANILFGPASLERFGKLYERESLPSQLRAKRLARKGESNGRL